MSKPSVLIVDDVEANLRALEAVMSDLPCELVLAKSGNEALRWLLRQDFAVMLLDVRMPEMDGYEVARYARDNPKTSHVPIIFLTAFSQNEEGQLRAYGSGAVDYVQKPIDAAILKSKVRVFLDLWKQRVELEDEIAAHRATMRELEVANEALRHFNHAAAHDLREPLRGALGFLDALGEEAGPSLSDESKRLLSVAVGACRRLSSLLEALQEYARIQRAPTLAPVDLGEVYRRVTTDLHRRTAESKATLTADELPVVIGDESRMYQVMLNLIGNALKFAREGEAPRIHVGAKLVAGEYWISVSDNGIGISQEYREKVFEAFQRLHSGGRYEGSGLGLTICKSIIEQQGGRIWVDSKEGEGSTFCFTAGPA